MADAELIVEAGEVQALAAEWDALAVANAVPTSSPAWMLAWWRHAAPRSAQLRVIAVRAGAELVGILPFYTEVGGVREYRLLADTFSSSVTPLARPDRVWEVAEAAAVLLARPDLRPDAIELGPVAAFSPWSAAMRERWPGRMRPLAYRRQLLPAPIASLAYPSFDAWMAARRSNFRSGSKRRIRRFEQDGGTYRLATRATLEADVTTFARLHTARWAGLGASRLVEIGERLPSLLTDLGRDLVDEERFRLYLLEVDGEPICAELMLAAGGEVASINLGWDERFKQLSPATLSLLHAIRDGIARGDRRMELGWGRIDYKQPYADGGDAVAWDVLLPPGRRLPRALAMAAPAIATRRARETVKRALSPEQASRLRALRGAIPGGGR